MKKLFFGFIVFWGFFAVVSQTLHAKEMITTELKKKLKSIEVVGNATVPTDLITSVIHAKVGQYYDEASVNNDRQNILNLGEFDSVDLKQIDAPGGVSLLFIVKETDKVIKAIKIKGNIKIGRDEVRACLRLNEGAKYNYQLIKEDVARIYGLKQFEDVKVYKEEIPGGFELTYVVTEFPVLSTSSGDGKFGPVEFHTLPSKAGVPYVRSKAVPGFTDKDETVTYGSSSPDYYKEETFKGPKQGQLMINIGASHNFLGSK